MHAAFAVIVAILVAGVLVTRSVTAHAEQSVHAAAHVLGKNMIILPAAADIASFYAHRFDGAGIPETHREALLRSPAAQHIQALETRLYGTVDVLGTPLLIVGQDGEWPPAAKAVPAVLGASAARRLGAGAGSSFRFGGRMVSVVGVRPTDPEGLDDALFLPLPAAQHVLHKPGEITTMRAGGCWCRIDVAALGREIERFLPGVRAVTVAGMLAAQRNTVAVVRRHGAFLQTAAAGIAAALAILVAGANARRRSRELALAAAVGMPPAYTVALFATEAAVSGAVGAAVGFALGAVGSPWVTARLLGDAAPPPSVELLVPLVVASAVLCAIAALGPALRAAGRDPVTILSEGQT